MNKDFNQKFSEQISNAKNVLITAHMGPDHDALGSSLALLKYLQQSHDSVVLAIESQVNEGFNYLAGFSEITWAEDLSIIIAEKKIDLLIVLDANSWNRLTSGERPDLTEIATICIDHHTSEGEDFDLEIIDNTATSTSQLLFEAVFVEQNVTAEIASLLVEGIMGDTGSLNYIRKHNARVLPVVQKLVEIGDLNLEEINNRFSTIKINRLPVLQEYLKNTVNIDFDNGTPGLTYSYASEEFVESLEDKTVLKHSSYQFMILRRIENHPWGFMVRPSKTDKGEFNISFRSSVGAPNVRLICEQYFGGGGHNLAAGGRYQKESDEEITAKQVCEKIVEIIKQADIEIVN